MIVYCTASWMPHMRIALSNTLLSVSDYAASFNCPSWTRSRPRTSRVRGDLLQYTCWLVANSLRNIVKQCCWHENVPKKRVKRGVFCRFLAESWYIPLQSKENAKCAHFREKPEKTRKWPFFHFPPREPFFRNRVSEAPDFLWALTRFSH